jgi:hypothetical protein
MTIKQTNVNKDFNTKEYMFDNESEFSSLPIDCGMGSTALCIVTGNIYVLNSSGEWVEL